jgi:hypothetical protein
MCLPPVSGASVPRRGPPVVLPQVLQQRYHQHIDNLGVRGVFQIREGWDQAWFTVYRRGRLCQVNSEPASEFWAEPYSLISSRRHRLSTLINVSV